MIGLYNLCNVEGYVSELSSRRKNPKESWNYYENIIWTNNWNESLHEFLCIFRNIFISGVWWARAWKLNNYSLYVTYFTRNISRLLGIFILLSESRVNMQFNQGHGFFCSLSLLPFWHISTISLDFVSWSDRCFILPSVHIFKIQIDPMIWTTWGKRISVKNYQYSSSLMRVVQN